VSRPATAGGPGKKELDPVLAANLLYYDEQRSGALMKDWPSARLGESMYYSMLSQILVEAACTDKDHWLAESLVRDLSGVTTPRRPILELAIAREWLPRLKKLQKNCPTMTSAPRDWYATIEASAELNPLGTVMDEP
jgi:hypothetical protein